MKRARDLSLAGALLCALAALLATSALYIPGLAMLLAAAVAPAWVALSAARAEVALHTPVRTVYEGETVRLAVTVRRGLIPFPGAALVPAPGVSPVALPRSRTVELGVPAVALRRGPRTLGPARLRVADPLGICTRELQSAAYELLVLPRVHPVRGRSLGSLDGHARPLAARDSALELDWLRPHEAGGSASRIHWPTVARTGTLMERSFTTETDQRVLVMLDARRPESEQALDQALRATASLCVHLARRGGCELLLPDDHRPAVIGADMRSWPALHARLALIRSGGGGHRATHLRHPRTVLYVTASTAAAPTSRGLCCRVGPHPLAGVGVAFTVAGCSGQVVSGGAWEAAA